MGQNMHIKVLLPEIVFKIAAGEAVDRMSQEVSQRG